LPETRTDDAPDLIVIPARFGSTRLPGKPLIEIAGRTLLERVVAVGRAAAAIAGNAEILVATDDARIADHARELGCDVVMTDARITTGSGRSYAAAVSRRQRPAIVVNLQGDAPFIPAEIVGAVLTCLRTSDCAVATPVVRLDWASLDALRAHKRIAPFSGTTCTRAADGRALWFSKTIIPAIRNEPELRAADSLSPAYRHLGLYAYRLEALDQFERTPPTPYERIEGLEQLRFLESGSDILTIAVDPPRYAISGIDTRADVDLAERLIAELGDPHPA
jgi:3-deoxy-manno-octulosonate cytidylyltransferase (CMP-KDO synthetase)